MAVQMFRDRNTALTHAMNLEIQNDELRRKVEALELLVKQLQAQLRDRP